jgi:hypothetical protein
MKSLMTSMISATIMLVGVGTASAQSSNTPYFPGASRSGAGISFGYRQAILNAKILGQRPRALVRGPSGALLDVQQAGRNAMVVNPGDGSFVPGARPNQGWPMGLGTGLGWNLASYYRAGGGYYSPSGESLNSWISLVPSGPDGARLAFGLYNDDRTPIDAWIMQLEL